MTKRKIYKFKKGSLIEVEEYHDGHYGAPGAKRSKKRKPTQEQVQIINSLNKARLARHKLLEYFAPADIFATLTYSVENRPPDMERAKSDFKNLMRKLRREYAKRNVQLRWMRNIEQGTKGAWHIHLVIKDCEGAVSILQDAWQYGGIYVERIAKSKLYDKDMSQLASYMTKDEKRPEKKKNGEPAKKRIREASYSTSRNMPLKKPKVEKLFRWAKEPKVKKGYYMAKCHEGINPVTGYQYRRYTMYRMDGKEKPRQKP